MTKVFWLAFHTCSEILRQRILYTVLFFVFVLIGTGSVLDTVAPGQQGTVVLDVGLGTINLFGVLLAIVMGVSLLHQELDRKTVYNILAKPLGRGQFVTGKYLGLVAAIAIVLAGMLVALIVAGFRVHSGLTALGWMAFWNIFLEISIVSAIALLFSSFSTPYLSGLFTLGIWAVCSMAGEIRNFQYIASLRGYRALVEKVFYLLPDLSSLNLKDRVPYEFVPGLDMMPPPGYMLHSTLYAVAWCAGLVLLAVVVFRQRDFK